MLLSKRRFARLCLPRGPFLFFRPLRAAIFSEPGPRDPVRRPGTHGLRRLHKRQECCINADPLSALCNMYSLHSIVYATCLESMRKRVLLRIDRKENSVRVQEWRFYVDMV